MTTNKPTTYWAPSTALHKLESRHNNAPCILTDGPAEFNDVALVRLADYEALKADHEEEHFQLRQDRDAHFGELIRALEQVDALQSECEKLRKDAEFGRSVLAKREPGKAYGCHCDIDEGVEPDGCVIDSGERHYCIYAKDITVKEQCDYWRVIASDAAMEGDQL